MAQSGYTPILIYGSGTATNVPLAANMTSSASGAELALNYADGKLYFKNSSGVVTLLAGSGGGPAGGSKTQVQYNSSGSLAGSANLIFNGTNLGLGITPNAAWSSFSAIQLGGNTYNAIASSNSYMAVYANTYYDGTNFKYVSTAGASTYTQNGGAHYFSVASSGTAGNNITFTQAMVIDGSGNVGIGTSSPSYPLQVSKGTTGAIAFMVNPSGLTNFAVIPSNSSGTGTMIGTTGGDTFAFMTGNAEKMRIDSSGNVGIGTTGAGSKLQVNGIVSSIGSGTSIFAVGETGTYTLTGVTSPNYGIAYGTLTGGANPAITVSGYDAIAFGTSQAERMRIDSSGNVGIGTSSPSSFGKFAVISTGVPTTAYASILSGAGSYNGGFESTLYIGSSRTDILNNGSIAGYRLKTLSPDAGSAYLAFEAASSSPTSSSPPTTFSERMRIDSSGNVLIGRTSRLGTEKFSVGNSNNGWNAAFVQDYSAANQVNLFLFHSYASGTNSATQILFSSNVGNTVGSITSSGTATVYNTTSDYRLKTVIGSVNNAGERIDALEPIEYDWITGGRTRGFLAHKFAEVYPNSVTGKKDAVDKDGKPDYQGMQASTPEVMADLIAEIQSLRKRVAQLESK